MSALRLDRIPAAEDDPRRWGGGEDASPDHDRWLREQRPPHWS